MPILATAIETDFHPVLHRSISGDEVTDCGEIVEHSVGTSTPSSEVHRKIDVAMSALANNFLASLSVSNRSVSSASECILSEVVAQWDALSHREKDAAYKISADGGCDYLEFNRNKISSYFFTIIDGKELDRRIVSVALSYLKSFLTRCPSRTPSHQQLAMLTSLYVAIKIHSNIYENGRPNIFISEVVDWSGNVFTAREISKMERSMLNALDYYMNPPIAEQFLDIIAPLIDDDLITPQVKQHIITISNWLCEISCTDSYFTGVKPSSVAYAAILVAMDSSHAGTSVKCWFESLDLKHDAYITLQCYERMYELYCLLDLPQHDDSHRCLSPTEVGLPSEV